MTNKQLYLKYLGVGLLYRARIIELYLETELPNIKVESLDASVQTTTESLHHLDLVCATGHEEYRYAYLDPKITGNKEGNLFLLENRKDRPILHPEEPLMVEKGMIDNYTKSSPLKSSCGLFLLNMIVYASIFKDRIPYTHDMNLKKMSKEIGKMVLNKFITVEEYYQLVNHIFYIGDFTELNVPTFSEKAIVAPKTVTALRDKLLKQYEGQLNDPNIAVKIEDACIEEDIKALQGDPSADFFAVKKKEYDVTRKKMHTFIGGIEKFSSSKGASEYVFLPHSLEDGWKPDDIPLIASELRKGSYDRGSSTAKGGELTKFLMRVFQNVTITEEDCGTKQGTPILITKDAVSDFENRYGFINKKEVLLTKDVLESHIGKVIEIRGPHYCLTKNNNYCYKCMGKLFKDTNQQNIGLNAINIGSRFLSLSMKSMHGTKMKTYHVDKLSKFCL